MKTTLIGDEPQTEEQIVLEISDDEFDANGFLTLTIQDKSIELHIKDLLSALVGFDAKYSRSKEEDELLTQ